MHRGDNCFWCFDSYWIVTRYCVQCFNELLFYGNIINPILQRLKGFPGGTDGKESACNTGDLGSIPELGRSPGEGNGNPLQYSCLENSMDRESGGLQSMGLQRVRHDWVTNTHTHRRKLLSLRRNKSLIKRHTTNSSQGRDSNSCCLFPKPVYLQISQYLFLQKAVNTCWMNQRISERVLSLYVRTFGKKQVRSWSKTASSVI